MEIIADKINLAAPWTHINLKPEVESLEFSPIINLDKKNKLTSSKTFIFVKNTEESLIKNLKSKLENFKL